MWITLLITIGGTILIATLYLLGGAGLPQPDLVGWVRNNGRAIDSPPLAALLREKS